MIAAVIARAEKNSGPRRTLHLAAVIPDVDVAGLQIFGEPMGRRRKRRAVIARRRNRYGELPERFFFHQRGADVNFFMHWCVVDYFWRDWLALRLIPTIDDFLRLTLQPESIDAPRRRQRSNHYW